MMKTKNYYFILLLAIFFTFANNAYSAIGCSGGCLGFGGVGAENIKFVQKLIGADVDGVFGPKTLQKLKEWQSKNGTPPDGKFGNDTAEKMAAKFTPEQIDAAKKAAFGDDANVKSNLDNINNIANRGTPAPAPEPEPTRSLDTSVPSPTPTPVDDYKSKLDYAYEIFSDQKAAEGLTPQQIRDSWIKTVEDLKGLKLSPEQQQALQEHTDELKKQAAEEQQQVLSDATERLNSAEANLQKTDETLRDMQQRCADDNCTDAERASLDQLKKERDDSVKDYGQARKEYEDKTGRDPDTKEFKQEGDQLGRTEKPEDVDPAKAQADLERQAYEMQDTQKQLENTLTDLKNPNLEPEQRAQLEAQRDALTDKISNLADQVIAGSPPVSPFDVQKGFSDYVKDIAQNMQKGFESVKDFTDKAFENMKNQDLNNLFAPEPQPPTDTPFRLVDDQGKPVGTPITDQADAQNRLDFLKNNGACNSESCQQNMQNLQDYINKSKAGDLADKFAGKPDAKPPEGTPPSGAPQTPEGTQPPGAAQTPGAGQPPAATTNAQPEQGVDVGTVSIPYKCVSKDGKTWEKDEKGNKTSGNVMPAKSKVKGGGEGILDIPSQFPAPGLSESTVDLDTIGPAKNMRVATDCVKDPKTGQWRVAPGHPDYLIWKSQEKPTNWVPQTKTK